MVQMQWRSLSFEASISPRISITVPDPDRYRLSAGVFARGWAVLGATDGTD